MQKTFSCIMIFFLIINLKKVKLTEKLEKLERKKARRRLGEGAYGVVYKGFNSAAG